MKKRLLHLTYMPHFSLGILNKIQRIAEVAYKNKIPVYFMILNLNENRNDNNLFLKKITFFKNIPKRIQLNFMIYKLIEKNVKFDDYDLIILRHFISPDFFFFSFFKKFGKKIYSEHHTLEEKEYHFFLKEKNDFLNKIKYMSEKFLTPFKLRLCKGIISVTDEIGDYERKRSGNTNIICIPNGMFFERLDCNYFVKNIDNKCFNMIMVVSNCYPWHGLERILKSTLFYEGDLKINFFVVGSINQKLIDRYNNLKKKKGNINVQFIGKLSKKELEKFYKSMHLAISTMALYKLKMNQACPLKSCEYISHGLPFIYAYDDPNIHEHYKFALKFPNDNSLIDFNEVIDFVYRVYKDKEMNKNIYDYAKKNIAYEKTLEQYINLG